MSKQEEIKIGDNVHVGMRQKGGAGISGTVTKIDGDRVHIKGHHDGKTYRGALEFTMKESEEFEDFDEIQDIEELDESVPKKWADVQTTHKGGAKWRSSSIVDRRGAGDLGYGELGAHGGKSGVFHFDGKRAVDPLEVRQGRTKNGWDADQRIRAVHRSLKLTLGKRNLPEDFDEMDEAVFDKQKFVVHFTDANDGKKRRRTEESFGPAGIVRKLEMSGHKVHDITHNGESVMHIARKVIDARMNEAYGEEDHIQQTLADRDINSKIDGNTVVVHKSNVAKTKQILKKMGHDHEVRGGLNESFDFGIPSFSDFLSEMTGEPTIEECYAMAVEDFLMSEEFEQLDEISKKTLGSYIKKAKEDYANIKARKGEDAVRYAWGGDFPNDSSFRLYHKGDKRKEWINRAVDRLTKEEFEQLDELSKGTLKDYIRKASSQQFDLGKNLDKGDVEHFIRTIKKTGRRHSGILRATGQLARESEQIDELSPYTLASYITQASLDLDKQSRNQGRKIAKGEPGEEEQERGNKRIKGIVKAGYKLARKANRNQN